MSTNYYFSQSKLAFKGFDINFYFFRLFLYNDSNTLLKYLTTIRPEEEAASIMTVESDSKRADER